VSDRLRILVVGASGVLGRAARAFSRSIEGLQIGQTYRVV
jgi:hypothetical protein